MLAGYTNKYWDVVTYHQYISPGNLSNFDDLMALANGNLATNTTSYVTNYLMPLNNADVTYIITEQDAASGHGGPLNGTLYGGIYSAEYALRMSTLPQVKYVASFQLQSAAGIDVTNNNFHAANVAYNNGYTTNTAGLNFGFFLSAQAAGEAVADGALYRSTQVYATTTTGGPTVPTAGSNAVPAVYAQAYQGGNGKNYVVVINKGASNLLASIKQDGVTQGNANTNQFLETFVTGADPSLTNSNPPPNNVQIQTQTGGNPVTIPPYSVLRLEWQAFDVTAALAHVDRVQCNSDSPLDRPDERDLHRATLVGSACDLVNGRLGSRHPDQSGVHQLAHRPVAILPAGGAMRFFELAGTASFAILSSAFRKPDFQAGARFRADDPGRGTRGPDSARSRLDLLLNFYTNSGGSNVYGEFLLTRRWVVQKAHCNATAICNW